MKRAGIYIHIPFCQHKCGYCDFYSLPYGDRLAERYVRALIHQLSAFEPMAADTVYLGGGTPSMLSSAHLGGLLTAIRGMSAVAEDAEITMELNPENAAPEHLRLLRAMGINRLSIGVQSCDDAMLRQIGRGHTARQATDAILMAADAGFENISADFLLGLPGQTTAMLDGTIDTLAALPLTHLSAYLLKVDAQSDFARRNALPDDDAQAGFYEHTVERLARAGFAQYEISNFARKGKTSRHNEKYWRCEDYIGLGASAHSAIRGRRYSFARNLDFFLALYEDETPADWRRGLQEEGPVTVVDAIILGLRLNEGLNMNKIDKKYHFSFSDQTMNYIRLCEREGFMEWDKFLLKLTLKGMLISNTIFTEILRRENLS